MTDEKFDAGARSYRTDIDGLRAIAIVSVILFHVGMPLSSGGFTGVDIFFVISGYLIGGHILSELRNGSFSFLRFYQRRAKRILPAYFVVICFTMLTGLVLLSPFEAADLGRGAFAATLSASNILFWKTAGYFDTHIAFNPLLMTWSLGVEEQFYAVIPLLLVLLTHIRRNWLLPAILTGCTISFLFAQGELASHPTTVFYMLPARAWELGIGVALAAIELRGKRIAATGMVAQGLSIAGLVLISAPVCMLSEATPFPGASALPSVLGTAFLLAVPGSWINSRLLSVRPLVFIGKVSYSWYLWHWPLLAFARVVYGDQLPRIPAACLAAAAFVAAVFSYYFVEQPFRKSKQAPGPLLLRYGAVSAVVLVLSATLWLSRGMPWRNPQLAAMEDSTLSLQMDPCLLRYGKEKPILSPTCDDPADEPKVALWGDSHSAALAPGLRSVAMAQGYGFVQLGKVSCPPLIGATRFLPGHPSLAAECVRFNQTALEELKADRHIRLVILAGFWAAPFRRNFQEGWLVAEPVRDLDAPTLSASQDIFTQSLTASIRSLQAAGKRVIIFDDVPIFVNDPVWLLRTARIPARRSLARWLGKESDGDPGAASPADSSAAAEVTRLLQRTAANFSNVEVVDVQSALCAGSSECIYRDGDRMLYVDPQHLSANGARYALRDFHLPLPAKQIE